MMIDETDFGARLAEIIRERAKTAVLVRHAGKRTCYVESVGIIQRKLAAGKTPYITQKHAMRRGPTRADCVELTCAYFREIQACADGVVWKAGIVFDPANAFLSDSEQQFAIPSNARGRVVHLRIVEPQRNHCGSDLNFEPLHHVIGVCTPVKSSTTPPAASIHWRMAAMSSEAPRQLFPAISGDSPNKVATPRLTLRNPSVHGKSTIFHASLPFQFIVIVGTELN